MSLSDDDEPIDWKHLSSSLSPHAFAALQGHLLSSDGGEKVTSDSSALCKKSDTKGVVNNAVFKEQDYWEERFADEEKYDWLLSFEQLQIHLIPLLDVTEQILIVGCGNSGLSAGLYDAGFKNIVNIDFSETVVDKMKIAHSEQRPLMQWITMDMTDMNFDPMSFDVVIDKASMDALMVDEGDVWNPHESTIDITDKMCIGISKILKLHSGKFIQLSFAQPHFRTKYLMGLNLKNDDGNRVIDSPYESSSGFCERYGWTLSFTTIDTEAGCLNSFLYVMRMK